MEPETSSQSPQKLAGGVYSELKEPLKLLGYFCKFVTRYYLLWGFVTPTPNPHTGEWPLVGYSPYMGSNFLRLEGTT